VPVSLRGEIERILDDMQARHYRTTRFKQALGWPACPNAGLLQACKKLLRSPDGQTSAYEYKVKYPNGLVLEDVVINNGTALGFDAADVALARRTLGLGP